MILQSSYRSLSSRILIAEQETRTRLASLSQRKRSLHIDTYPCRSQILCRALHHQDVRASHGPLPRQTGREEHLLRSARLLGRELLLLLCRRRPRPSPALRSLLRFNGLRLGRFLFLPGLALASRPFPAGLGLASAFSSVPVVASGPLAGGLPAVASADTASNPVSVPLNGAAARASIWSLPASALPAAAPLTGAAALASVWPLPAVTASAGRSAASELPFGRRPGAAAASAVASDFGSFTLLPPEGQQTSTVGEIDGSA